MQNLAEYLASEQAREDVRRVVQAKPHMFYTERELSEDRWWSAWLESSDHGKWARVAIEQDNGPLVTAYYRPDGDRYVVTDLGDGVRALRLRTGVLHSRAAAEAAKARQGICRDQEWTMGGTADLELEGFKPEQLPDAICRVMLASLRVMEAVL